MVARWRSESELHSRLTPAPCRNDDRMYRMLDLTTEAVTGWLQAIQPARTNADWPPAIRALEEAPEAVDLLRELSIALGKHQVGDATDLASSLSDPAFVASLRTVLAQLGAGRMLRIIALLADITGDGTIALVQRDLRDSRSADGRALGAALDAMAQTTLRGRLTAEGRLAALGLAVEQLAGEGAS